MRRLLALCIVIAGCNARRGLEGQCAADSDCTAPAICSASSPHVCVVPEGMCFPVCKPGESCQAGTCQPITSDCNPVCTPTQQCVNHVCQTATMPSIALLAPGPNDFVTDPVHASAAAIAGDGVTSVRFEVHDGSGAIVSSATTTTPASGSTFNADVSLTGAAIPDGPATIVAVLTHPAGTLTTAPTNIRIDRTPPVITLGSVTPWMGPAISSATVTATVIDAGKGVDPSTVKLTLKNGKTYTGAGAASLFTFTVPMADLGTATSMTFTLDASDLLGNKAASLAGAAQVLQIDNVPPSLGITADVGWHVPSETVAITGPASDAQSGLGAVTVTSTANGGLTLPGAFSGANFTASVNLTTLTFASGFEGQWPFTVTLTDKAGNQTAKPGSLNIDNNPPTVGAPAIAAGQAEYHDAAGNIDWYRASGANITITAVISDAGSGVLRNSSTPCITAVTTTCYPFTSFDGSTGTFTFSLPRSEGAGKSGAVMYTVSAQDVVGLPGSNTGQIYFDGVAPAVTIASDTTWFIRSGITMVSATISEVGSGLSAAPPTMTVGSNPPVLGAPNGAGAWQFALDLSQAQPGAEGPLQFTVAALDNVGNSGSAMGFRNVDEKPPAIAITADPVWYARTLTGGGANMITVNATITDMGSGVDTSNANKPILKVNGVTVTGTAGTGSNWTFTLDATQAPTNTEAALQYSVSALDKLGNPGTMLGQANIDDKPPQISNVQVVLSSNGSAQTTYLYTDSIKITGDIIDNGAGLAVSPSASPPTPSYQLNGVGPGSTGVPLAINGCTSVPKTDCSFTVGPVSLRALTFNASTGNVTLTIAADDTAVGGSHHQSLGPINVPVTRVKWSAPLSGNLASVSGLAIHPNGDVIVTGAPGGGNDSIVALNPDGTVFWHKGNNWYGPGSHLGQIDGAPSIGAVGNSPNIYVATVRKDLVAITPAGAAAWYCGTGSGLGIFHNTPAIVQAPVSSGVTCEAALAGADDANLYGACMNTTTTCTAFSSTMTGNAGSTPVSAAGGNVFEGDGNDFVQRTLANGPAFTGTANVKTSDSGVFTATAADLSTQGSPQVYFLNPTVKKIYARTTSLGFLWTTTLASSVTGPMAIEPSTGALIFNTSDKKLHSMAASNGTDNTVTTTPALSASGNTPLLGSGGYMYFGDSSGKMLELQDQLGFTTIWSFTPSSGSAAVTVAPTMDCSGTLYFVEGTTVYALITDSAGLRQNSPWPKFQRDSRNSGNADATTLWGAQTASGCTQ